MAKSLALGLQIVQDRHVAGPGGAHDAGVVDDPGLAMFVKQIGHGDSAVLHRASPRHASAVKRRNFFLDHIAGKNCVDAGEIFVAKFGDGVLAHHRVIGKRYPRVGATNIGNKG